MTEGYPAIRRTWKGIWQAPLAVRNLFWQGSGEFKGCGFAPNEHQSAILCSPERIKLITGGERSGKSYITAAELYIWLWQLGDGDVVWIVGPSYELARPEFEYLQQYIEQAGLIHPTAHVSTPRIGSWSMYTRPGALVVTKSSSDPQTLAGVPPAAVAMVECAQSSYETLLRLMGRVSQKRGPLLMSGTFESSLGWLPPLFSKWRAENEDGAKSFSLPSWTNTAIYPGGREDPEIKRLESLYPPDYFMERLGGEPCAPSRLVLREFNTEKHIKLAAEFDPNKNVQLWVDPGYAHTYAVLAVHAERDPERVTIFDEIAETGRTVQQIIDMVKQRPWWPNVKAVVIDKAAKQHPASESQAETWAMMTGKRITLNYVPIEAGILRHRTFLMADPLTGEPKLRIHPRCKHLIWEYGNYMYAKDFEDRPTSEVPVALHDDCLKAVAYGLVANYNFVEQRKRRRVSVSY